MSRTPLQFAGPGKDDELLAPCLCRGSSKILGLYDSVVCQCISCPASGFVWVSVVLFVSVRLVFGRLGAGGV